VTRNNWLDDDTTDIRESMRPRARAKSLDRGPSLELVDATDLEATTERPDGDRWSTYNDPGIQQGPTPIPDWVVTEDAAVDNELGIVKTGKEADVFLVERLVPGTDRNVLLAAKRYRDLDHRSFRRDATYLEGRSVRESRQRRAMANRSKFGRTVLAGEWAIAEFGVLSMMWQAKVPVPYPVQLDGTELLMEFIGDRDGTASPRLAETRPDPDLAESLWRDCLHAMSTLARAGYAHGDLSPYNLLVHDDTLVMIDVPQAVDIVTNPQGADFLLRDVRNVAGWFNTHGVTGIDPDEVLVAMLSDGGM
jgi:RIO kinase 1